MCLCKSGWFSQCFRVVDSTTHFLRPIVCPDVIRGCVKDGWFLRRYKCAIDFVMVSRDGPIDRCVLEKYNRVGRF